MEPSYYLHFRYSELGGSPPREMCYRIVYDYASTGVDVSKEEFEALTSAIVAYGSDPKNYDMVSWTSYGDWLLENFDEYDSSEYYERMVIWANKYDIELEHENNHPLMKEILRRGSG